MRKVLACLVLFVAFLFSGCSDDKEECKQNLRHFLATASDVGESWPTIVKADCAIYVGDKKPKSFWKEFWSCANSGGYPIYKDKVEIVKTKSFYDGKVKFCLLKIRPKYVKKIKTDFYIPVVYTDGYVRVMGTRPKTYKEDKDKEFYEKHKKFFTNLRIKIQEILSIAARY